ncbi:MAG: hypothetical protein IJ685_04595 [Selenomonadaceae bacterium]|nr:hypothetical protein [Selenomonadaceae bacterium]
MGMSKDAVLDTLARFKVLQDEQNEAKFVAKEAGKTLISDSDVNKLASIEKGAQKNPDLSGYATNEKIQLAIEAIGSIFGGEYTPPVTPEPPTNPDDGGGDNDDPDDGDETITDEEVGNIFH